MTDLEKSFAAAQAATNRPRMDPDNDTLLELYSYVKRATEGDVRGDPPGAFDFVARAKYEAWSVRKGAQKGPSHAKLCQASEASAVAGKLTPSFLPYVGSYQH